MAQGNRVIGPGMLFNGGGDLSGFLESDPSRAQYLIYPGFAAANQSTEPIAMGLIDSGINADHPQLLGRIAEMRSFTEAGPEDRIGHGTSIAIGMLTSSRGAKIVSANVLDVDFSLQPETVLRALRWLVVEKRVGVINASLGFRTGEEGADELCKGIDALVAEGYQFLLVAAAGNLGPDTPMVPAACENPNVIAVASDEASSGVGDITAPRPIGLKRSNYLTQLSTELIEAQRLKEVLPYLVELRDLDPSNVKVLASLAGVAFTVAQTSLARDAATHWAKLSPGEPEAHWVLALSHANLGKLEDALESLDRVLALEPGYKNSTKLRALLASRPDDLSTALRDFFGPEE